jgi:hypothetical protein
LPSKNADPRFAALAYENLAARWKLGERLGGYMIVRQRRPPGVSLEQDNLKRPGIVGNMRFGRPLQQRIGNRVRFPYVLDFFLGLHERRKFLKLIKLTAYKNSDRPSIVGCPENIGRVSASCSPPVSLLAPHRFFSGMYAMASTSNMESGVGNNSRTRTTVLAGGSEKKHATDSVVCWKVAKIAKVLRQLHYIRQGPARSRYGATQLFQDVAGLSGNRAVLGINRHFSGLARSLSHVGR